MVKSEQVCQHQSPVYGCWTRDQVQNWTFVQYRNCPIERCAAGAFVLHCIGVPGAEVAAGDAQASLTMVSAPDGMEEKVG